MTRLRTALVAGLLAGTAIVAWAERVPELAPTALAAWLDAGPAPLLLDLRGRAAYLDGTVAGALDAGTDPAGFLPDGRGGDVVLITSAGVAVDPWRERLADFGYRVQVLAGDKDAWQAAGLRLERPEVSFVRPGTVPFVIPRGICELNVPADVFD